MFPLLIIAAVHMDQPSDIVVGGWDNRPTLIVAGGNRKTLAPLRTAAEQCGFSRTWVWGDNDEALLWVLAVEASRERTDCLNRWRTKHQSVQLEWRLHQSR